MAKKEATKKTNPLAASDEQSSVPAPEQVVQEEQKPVAKQERVAGNPAQAMLDSAEATKAILAKSPHTMFLVPLAEGEKPGAVETAQINGYKLTIQKGVMVNIPLAVANLIANKYKIQMTAGQDMLIERSSKVTDALE